MKIIWIQQSRKSINEVVDEDKKLCNTIYELDMAYDNLQESDESRKLFIPQMHPLETEKSLTLRRDLEETRMRMAYIEGFYYSFPHVDKERKRERGLCQRKYADMQKE